MLIIGITLGLILFAVLYFCWQNECMGQFILIALIAWGVVSCNRSDWYQAQEREKAEAQAAIDKAEATPRVIREADGCKVYTFKAAGHWHYYTSCNGSTVTESHRTETTGSGKSRKNVDVVETISQQNVK